MEQLRELLTLLSDGRSYSGEEIGAQLNVTRAAVWKQIKKLESIGIPIEACRGKGYRIVDGLSLLHEETIGRLISTDSARYLKALHVFGELNSTNDLALQRVQMEGASGHVFLAESQLQGKGRRGKHWVSPFGANIYMSLVMHFDHGAAAIEGLSLAVGVAVAQALDLIGVPAVRLKWPNDVLWDGCKLGGILLELVGDPMGACDVVVGVGLNVNMPKLCQPAIDQPWIDLRQIRGGLVDRNSVAAALINQLLPMLATYQGRGFAYYRHQWEQLDAMRDKPVVLTLSQHQIEGVARGVDEGGAIRIEAQGVLRSYPAGDVSLRVAQ